MKRLSWQLSLAAMCGVLTLLGWAAPAPAAEDNPGDPADRIQRLERRVNEMAQRQEQLLHRLDVQQQREAPLAGRGPEELRRPRPLRDRAAIGQPVPPVGAPDLAPVPAPAQQHPLATKLGKDIAGLLRLGLLIAAIFNILLAIWIFTDIRKRGEGSGLFVALALLAGIPAAIIYALVRLGDKKS